MDLHGTKVLVVGLARMGLASAAFLKAKGSIVSTTEMKPKEAMGEGFQELEGMALSQMEWGGHQAETFLRQDLIVVSPGVDLKIDPIQEALKKGVQVISEFELAYRFIQIPIIAVTGTNGKTTTTHLIGEMLKEEGKKVGVGGNVGEPLILCAEGGDRWEVLVVEISSLTVPRFGVTAATYPGGAGGWAGGTGYTGEDGVELHIPAVAASDGWHALLSAGLTPAGLGARDTLRLEARMCLYGNDIDETTTLIEAGLGWIVSLDEAKGDFIGRGVLEAQKKGGAPRKLVGFEVTGRGIARHGYPVFLHDEPFGSVTSETYAPYLQKNIGLVYLPADEVGLRDRVRRELEERVVR